jgi:hypothetical protein
MKYFIDTEFIEGSQKRLFSITKPTIDLISIGIVAEDGREYYAISKDFNLKEAWNRFDIEKNCNRPQGLGDKKIYWLRENVLKPIYNELLHKYNNDGYLPSRKRWDYKEFKMLINKYGKTNKQIANGIKEFCSIGSVISNKGNNVYYYKEFKESVKTWIKVEEIERNNPIHYDNKPIFYGYYSDYDWVVFCWLFGRMIDLPKGFPMYCIDLKQTLDELQELENSSYEHELHCNDITASPLKVLKELPNYPKQTNEHNALADAKWNKQLYEFLNTI